MLYCNGKKCLSLAHKDTRLLTTFLLWKWKVFSFLSSLSLSVSLSLSAHLHVRLIFLQLSVYRIMSALKSYVKSLLLTPRIHSLLLLRVFHVIVCVVIRVPGSRSPTPSAERSEGRARVRPRKYLPTTIT